MVESSFKVSTVARSKRVDEGACLEGLRRLGGRGWGRIRARGVSGSLGVGALVRGGVFCALGTATRYGPPRLTDGHKQPTNSSSSAPDKYTTTTVHILHITIYISPP
ncbi:hypothetical protein DPMN_150235 [Dreissena polymorpha]|uniref:Uncharacterized protein n=1 Tax=Dreissena polymorpha TaxID=45954 RepID=A0A9D4FF18_DREPO|nr:hypothetical protein DPMN_150235 [Dreissena polymorpha]